MNVSFVCLHAYPLFRPSVISVFGGTEVRAWLLARALARTGRYKVSFIVLDHGQSGPERIEGVDVIPHPAYRAPGFGPEGPLPSRFPRLSGRLARMRTRLGELGSSTVSIAGHSIARDRLRLYGRLGTDVFCVFGVSNLAAEVAVHCQEAHRKLVLVAGSDQDFSAEYRPRSKVINPYGSVGGLCHFAITAANALVVQTEYQARLLKEHFGRNATVVPNPIDLTESQPTDTKNNGPKVALWIGKSDAVKQPDFLLELAKRCPAIRFIAVMNCSDPEIFERFRGAAPPNVEIIERFPLAEADQLFARAFVLINTSRFEGFPNTFLQAGKHGIPVLSLQVDPDRFLARHECGVVADGELAQLERGLKRLEAEPALAARLGRNLRAYVEQHHRLEDSVVAFDRMLSSMTGPLSHMMCGG